MDEDQQSLPVSIRSFVTARIDEVIALSKELEYNNGQGPKKLAFQHVPKHMRRRAVSHNTKRLPKRLQDAHTAQKERNEGVKNDTSKKPKRPSRKYRRRKSNLLSEFNRRQQSIKWIETHIWHAKRFHIKKKWNYNIPIQPTDKSYRAIYRAYSNYSSMQDISYFSCIQLIGPFSAITEKLQGLIPKQTNRLSLTAKYYTQYSRSGLLHFYQNGHYPFNYIGPVEFMWNHDLTILWLWVHPSFKSELLIELVQVLDLKEIPSSDDSANSKPDPKKPEETSSPALDTKKLEVKNLLQPTTWRNSENVEVIDLEGALNRIRLYGPQSTSILQQVLRVKISPPVELMDTSSDYVEPVNVFWHEAYYLNKESFWEEQSNIWHGQHEFDHFPSHLILPLTVRDPRMFLPKKITKMKPDNESTQNDEEFSHENFQILSENYCKEHESPLYSKTSREKVLREKMSDKEFAKQRGKLLIPGTELNLGRSENQIPIMLIHKPEQMNGWDIVVPAGYAMSFWVALSYRAVRACGHRDALHFTFSRTTAADDETDSTITSSLSPNLFPPDSSSGQQESEETYNHLKDTYFKLPPEKRQHFHKLVCPFPFHIDWKILLQFWQVKINKESNDENPITKYFILRDHTILQNLQQILRFGDFRYVSQSMMLSSIPSSFPLQNCLVPIYVICKGRGKPQLNTIICLPCQSDLDIFYSKSEQSTTKRSNEEHYPVEPSPSNEYLNQIDCQKSILRQSHKKYLAFLRKKRKKQIDVSKQQKDSYNLKQSEYNSSKSCAEYNNKMNQLYLPQDPAQILNQLSRVPVGFITFGAESYKIGKCAGIGYITWYGLMALLSFYQDCYQQLVSEETTTIKGKKSSKQIKKQMMPLVLIRDCTASLLYRFAQLYIC